MTTGILKQRKFGNIPSFVKRQKNDLLNKYMQITELYDIINNNIQLKICFVAGNTYIWRKICLISPHGENFSGRKVNSCLPCSQDFDPDLKSDQVFRFFCNIINNLYNYKYLLHSLSNTYSKLHDHYMEL